ncbi:MAG: VOC family protein [Rhizobiaceae bacterium]|nr:VOC family protein [Rhizobiaceae bacterium]
MDGNMQTALGQAEGGRQGGDPFLGNAVEIALVTRDARRTIAGLWALGIGPWRIYTFDPTNTTNQTYRGRPSPFVMKVCFAAVGQMIWEVIEPISGDTIFSEFLDSHGEGLHHIAYDCNGSPFEERVAEFERRGFSMIQGGSWMGQNHFAFFGTEESTSMVFETYFFPDDWVYPEPEGLYPSEG